MQEIQVQGSPTKNRHTHSSKHTSLLSAVSICLCVLLGISLSAVSMIGNHGDKADLVSWINGSQPGSRQILRPIKVLKVVLSGGMEDGCVLHHFQVLLRHIGDLRGWPVSGIHQNCIVWLASPRRVSFVHLFQPGCRGTCCFVPAHYDSSVTPPLMFDHLPNPELNMWRSRISRFWTLSKVAIFVPELENLHCRTFAQRVHQSKRVQHDIPHLEVEQPLAPRFPRLNSQPTLPDVSPLSNQLADRISSVRLCAAHILADEQLRWDTQEKGCQLNMLSLYRHCDGSGLKLENASILARAGIQCSCPPGFAQPKTCPAS